MKYSWKKGDRLELDEEFMKEHNWNFPESFNNKEILSDCDVETNDPRVYIDLIVEDKLEISWFCGRFRPIKDNFNVSKNKKMEKKIYTVLTVNKKTGKTKKEIVVSDNEQSAILKAFGVDADNTFIKVTEEGKYVEEKPVQAVLVKEEKK